MMTQALERQELKGLLVKTKQMSLCQSFNANNTTLIIEASVENARACMDIGDRFGRASGLYFKWQGMKAIYIGGVPTPPEFDELG
jgi:hypothetical protein